MRNLSVVYTRALVLDFLCNSYNKVYTATSPPAATLHSQACLSSNLFVAYYGVSPNKSLTIKVVGIINIDILVDVSVLTLII